MKHLPILVTLLSFAQPSHAEETQKLEEQSKTAPSGNASVRTVLKPSRPREVPFTLQPGEHLEVGLPSRQSKCRRFLRVVGHTVIPAPYQARGEGQFRRYEWQIDDSLDAVHRFEDPFSLYFEGFGEDFERLAWHRIGGEKLPGGSCDLRMHVKRDDFAVDEAGAFGLTLELFLNKEDRHRHDVYDPPDQTLFLPIPPGNGDFTEIRKTVQLPDNIASAVIAVGGQGFRGECWVEGVTLLPANADPVARPFTRARRRRDSFNYWVGSNLVTRNWPEWKLSAGGKPLFEGRVFDRASNVADFYLPLPDGPARAADLVLELGKHPVAASFPYRIRSVELIESRARAFEVIHSPRFIARDRPFGLLVETHEPETTLTISASPSVEAEQSKVSLAQPGLHVLRFRAVETDTSATVTLADGERRETVSLGQIIEKPDDPVRLSVGDHQYVRLDDPIWPEFFNWYVGQRIGNFFHFRPSYQWSGVRRQPEDTLKHYLRLLEGLGMPFAWQVEGRTIAGHSINPSAETLASPLFRGFQAHEDDGSYYYWRHFNYKGFSSDIAARHRPYGGIFAKHRPIFTDHGNYVHYDRRAVTDMPDGARRFVDNLRYSKGPSTRHTGPSSLFRYFYQAGYDWLGAEQMYGPEETILAALRGASRAYGRSDYGTLHAMQWGSKDYANPRHAERFFLSLALAWMHGASHVHTEDALWIDEFGHDRFSPAGMAHIDAQQRLHDMVETRQRRGDLHTRIAVIQGRDDAWKCFGRGPVWSQDGKKWAFNRATESFDLLSVFHPGHVFNVGGPNGWFTATPHGPIDLVPVEASTEALKRYKLAIFLGWNSYDPDDIARLAEFVEGGGTLLLSAAHLNANPQPDEAPGFPTEDGPIRRLLGDDWRDRTARANSVTELMRGEELGRNARTETRIDVPVVPGQVLTVELELTRDDYAHCHAELIEPVFTGPEGAAKMAGMPMISRESGWEGVHIGRKFDGTDIIFNGRRIDNSIWYHAPGHLSWIIPEGVERFQAVLRSMAKANGQRVIVKSSSAETQLEIPRGKGRVIFFPQAVYPAAPEIRDDYTAAIRAAATAANAGQHERGWIESGPHIGFTPWDDGPRRTLHLLNIDWKSDEPARSATLALGEARFPVAVRRNQIESVHCAHGLAVIPGRSTTEVLDIEPLAEGWALRVQTTAPDILRLYRATDGGSDRRNLPGPGIHSFLIPE